jgi:hypothetical protein
MQHPAEQPRPERAAQHDERRSARARTDATSWMLEDAARRQGLCVVLHDVARSTDRGGIDHVVIGPGGVTLMDSTGAHLGGRAVVRMRQRLHAVMTALALAGHDDVPVRAAICAEAQPAEDDELLPREHAGVELGSFNEIVRLALEDGPLWPDDVRAVHGALNAAFQVRGGATAPAPAAELPEPVTVDLPELAGPSAARRALRWIGPLGLLAIVAAFVIAVAALPNRPAAMTRTELDGLRPELRTAAAARAGGKVTGPRITTTHFTYRLQYRRGARCRVSVVVPRLSRTDVRTIANGCEGPSEPLPGFASVR